MGQKHEFEIITEKNIDYKAFINVLKYRAPHIHSEYELGLVLYGEATLKIDKSSLSLKAGDIFIINPLIIKPL